MTDMTDAVPFFASATAQLGDYVGRTLYVANHQTEGLTHADSLVQLPFRGNCLNWVLGHVLVSRGVMLAQFGEDAPLSEDETALYVYGSAPITADGEHVVPLARLLADLERTTEQLKALFDTTTPKHMQEIVDTEHRTTRLQKLQGLVWHETYHIGQLEFLRQAAGTDDHIF